MTRWTRSNKLKWICWMVGICTIALLWLVPFAPAAHAEGDSYYQQDELEPALQLRPVAIGRDSMIALKHAAVMPADGGRTLFFTITVANGGGSALSFLDYWVKVLSSSGAEFKAELVPQDKLKKEVPAGQQVDYKFYALVNDTTSLEELTFRVTRWDYSSSELETAVGDIRFPDPASTVMAPVAGSRTVTMGNMPVALSVSRWLIREHDSVVSSRLTLKLTNKGKASIRLPGYQYALRAANGAVYPLESASPADAGAPLLRPDVTEELQLKSDRLPASASSASWDLLVQQIIPVSGELKLNYPLASLRMPTDAADTPPLGETVDYSNAQGIYQLAAEKQRRMPWEDQDILSTDVSVSHRQSDSMPFPAVKAYYELDGGVRVDAKIVQTDRVVGVPPGVSVHVQAVAKIPYTYPFAETKLILEEQVSDTVKEEMAQFKLPPAAIELPQLAFGETQPITGAGRAAIYAPRELNVYTDGGSSVLEAQVEIVNMEKRSNVIPKLTAFFKTADDSLYPTKIREVKQKLNPQGKALLSFSGKLPKELDTKGLRLVIGESVTDQKLSGTDDKADSYINAVEMELASLNDAVSPTLKDVSFYPYSISLSNINTWLDSKQLKINFTYKLTKDSYYETSNEGSKLVIQFADGQGKVNIDETFFLETAPEDDDKKVTLGEHDYRITRQDDSLVFKIESLKQYKINIYHEFQGKRKLLASQLLDWFGTTD
ncbi:hypothetical protein [Paenibacillus piri]|uniref:Uncharacterized protein n=1 Tax=Paenibacillus piri TaxID=2547395 RepID=A0A4R5KVU4_9BACL|nr:hypothetical protein [Paenibacillus piri]TDF99622.1 hypothetical protein E1757_07255 [Paenibacillus piri]